jgi:hypothetical protein
VSVEPPAWLDTSWKLPEQRQEAIDAFSMWLDMAVEASETDAAWAGTYHQGGLIEFHVSPETPPADAL